VLPWAIRCADLLRRFVANVIARCELLLSRLVHPLKEIAAGYITKSASSRA